MARRLEVIPLAPGFARGCPARTGADGYQRTVVIGFVMANESRIDRSRVTLASFDEAEEADLDFWLSKTPTERIEGIEHLRRWLYGEAAVDQGLQRVLTAVELQAD
jgi:hypothetical protein